MCRRTASGVSLTETASAVGAGPGPWSAAAAGSPVLPRDVRRTSRRNAPATRDLRALSSSTVPLLILACPSYERRYRPPLICTRRPRTRCARVARRRRTPRLRSPVAGEPRRADAALGRCPLRAPPPAARATACARDVPIAAVRNCSASGGAPVGKNSPQRQVQREKACCGGALRREWGIRPQSRPPGARDAQRRRPWPPRRDDSRAPYRASLPGSVFRSEEDVAGGLVQPVTSAERTHAAARS